MAGRVKVKYIEKQDYIALKRDRIYDVISVEKGWYRIMTELGEDYLFPPEAFEIVNGENAKDDCRHSACCLRENDLHERTSGKENHRHA